MERYCSTGQSPQRAVAPTEEEEEVTVQLSQPVSRSDFSDSQYSIIIILPVIDSRVSGASENKLGPSESPHLLFVRQNRGGTGVKRFCAYR